MNFNSDYEALCKEFLTKKGTHKCYGHRLYCEEDDRLYSYGHHFCLAKLDRKKNVIFINDTPSTNTTRTHKYKLSDALRNFNYDVVYTNYPNSIEDSMKYSIELIDENIGKFKRARSRKKYYLNNLKYNIDNIRYLNKKFKVKIPRNIKKVLIETENLLVLNKIME